MLINRSVPAWSWFETYDHIGSQYPYFSHSAPGSFSTRIDTLLQQAPAEQRRIDPVGALGFLSKGYLMGNTTMVAGVSRAPWLGRPDGQGGWVYADVPRHGSAEHTPAEVVADLKPALQREMLRYVNGRRRVAVLLSGGLDSRIVAGTLRELQERGDYAGEVVAMTWGVDGCRDVIYSEEICRRYGWERVRLPLGPEQLRENLHIGAGMGAEFAPFHLHAMPKILSLDGIEAIIAGSYGDSVGRAEFSGARVWELKPTLGRRLDRFGLLRSAVRSVAEQQLQQIAFAYRQHVPGRTEGQYREIEQQLHYMRRRNQSPLTVIAEHVPLYQLFTAPETCRIMWALDFHSRGDQHYQLLLPTLPGGVGEIPWARNGQPLGNSEAVPDTHSKLSHVYGLWLRNELGAELRSLLESPALLELNLFNPGGLRWLAKVWPKATTRSVSMLDETVAWLGALALFAERYEIQGLPAENRQVIDLWESTRGYLYASAYQKARERLRV